ncbi:tRNA lysidine(34) synthetase TilS [Candidatus Formimonas warabiya]|uniref:tRNA(Ile)-lysidine synthase n=1 Tax=Formimonas warabiya TaxID=1761012 RepID=A0A3G1KX35_FORW1|nr:tRNA lysidine(34) synthetase TilS [Candidatus Formimonas warabiya]ATW27016.1 tRNA lysidine(34) synthetase TilS [Candidatus Formimonas warabiya]
MEKLVLKTIKKYGLILPGQILVAAVSGGPDSVAMLHLIRKLTVSWGVKIHVAHLNHMFRGAQSEEEACFVAGMAQEMGLDCTVESFDVPSYISRTGLSPEEGARNIRYSFLQRIAQACKADAVMTAHHANDQAETVLLHLIRGAGPEGLAAISPREGNLIRPLLETGREEILHYCREKRLAYRMDPSNEEDVYQRNKVRLDLIPRLKKLNPQIINALTRTANICRSENQLVQEITEEAMGQVELVRQERGATLDLNRLDQFHLAIRRRLIRKIVDDFTHAPGSLSFDHTEDILNLRPGKEICLPGRLYARKEKGRLIFSRCPNFPQEDFDFFTPVPLRVPGITRIPQLNISLETEVIPWPEPHYVKNKNSAAFHLNVLDGQLFVRGRLPGDRFQPKGLSGTKKLKDFFIDEKIPHEQRKAVPLVISGDKIIWVVGYRTGEQTEATPLNEKALWIKVKKLSRA